MDDPTQSPPPHHQSPPPSPPPPPENEDLPQTHSNPSKIPIRPPKIRKLSTNSTTTIPASEACTTNNTTASDGCTTPPKVQPPKAKRRSGFQASRISPQIIKPLSSQGEIELALNHLRKIDPLIAPLIDVYPPPQFDSHLPPFLALSKSILYQQLAYKAGTCIYSRFIALCGGQEFVKPDVVLAISIDKLKQIGVSGRKASYLFDLAKKYQTGILSDDRVVKMDDRSLFTMLSMVKGIGSWSVHMFMIFSLHRPDVLPVSDLGVRKGVQLLYGLDELPKPSQMDHLCEKWRPYRSVGAWYMWRFAEGKGAPTNGAAAGAALEENSLQPLQEVVEPEQDGGQQHQLQFVEPITSISNLGACIWETESNIIT
ncbi:DNA glycosylase [Lithospermum erythrorhizon]|uniref:DNA glycosylase n=1 Tax=Lithospermum erythrorhizon TaxID=34254 RepID=A0AAV3QXF1_LITER